ncbi:hypothetical protein ABZS66_00755 [Dactylosporangium sp. NPDC005572]|uniref:hypothetical protein n=1 Tax=Dactylosporangium sp. NPDC005572 TaxID=3156889 RepID=UPI0033B11BC7
MGSPNGAIETLIELARHVASIIPLPGEPLHGDAPSRRAWADLMLDAGSGIAAAARFDGDLLRRAVGVEHNGGVDPISRTLLEVALIVAAPSTPHVRSRGRGLRTAVTRGCRVHPQLPGGG